PFAGGCSFPQEPSDGLEPSTPSLPCAAERLPWVATGCGSACLSGFRAPPICHRLPPVAPAWLHECSILSPGIAMNKALRAFSHLCVECRARRRPELADAGAAVLHRARARPAGARRRGARGGALVGAAPPRASSPTSSSCSPTSPYSRAAGSP